MSDALPMLAIGLELGAAFNPFTAAAGAALAAAYVTSDLRARRTAGAAALATAWLAGDGLRVLGRARELHGGASLAPDFASAPAWAGWTAVALWVLVGVVIGYAVPAWAGAFAGRRTVLGLDWLVAGSVALTVSLATSGLLGSLGG